jgi:hypothetical protein
MSGKSIISNSYLEDIGDAIRYKKGTEETFYPSQMGDAIRSIEGIVPAGSIEIDANGTYNVVEKAEAVVNVQPDLRPLSVSENGTYQPDGFDGYSGVSVDVEPNLTSLAVTENGLYLPESGVDGFDRVSVNVPAPVTESLSVTENGTYVPSAGVDGFNEVVVDVPDQYLVKEWTEESENLAFCKYWTDQIPNLDISTNVYLMLFGNNDHANGVQYLIYGVREDTRVIAVRANAFRVIVDVYNDDQRTYALYVSAGTVVRLYRIPKTT